MNSDKSRRDCEAALIEHRAYNTEHKMLASHNLIIERMLERHLELREAYDEIHHQLEGVEQDIFAFFDSLLCIAATWNPEQVARSREGRRQLQQVNEKIAKAAEHLAALLDEREMLNDQSGFSSDTHYDICQVIEDASAQNGHFQGWVKMPFARLKSQFDMKYWPSLAACIRSIGLDAENPTIAASNSTTAAATTGVRSGNADFFKAFDHRLREEGRTFQKLHPSRLGLSDRALSALANCALGRQDEEMFDADYVKRWRQRERDGTTSNTLGPHCFRTNRGLC